MKVCMKKEKFLSKKKCLDWGFRVFVSFSSLSPFVSLPFPFVVWPHEHSGQVSALRLNGTLKSQVFNFQGWLRTSHLSPFWHHQRGWGPGMVVILRWWLRVWSCQDDSRLGTFCPQVAGFVSAPYLAWRGLTKGSGSLKRTLFLLYFRQIWSPQPPP